MAHGVSGLTCGIMVGNCIAAHVASTCLVSWLNSVWGPWSVAQSRHSLGSPTYIPTCYAKQHLDRAGPGWGLGSGHRTPDTGNSLLSEAGLWLLFKAFFFLLFKAPLPML